MRILIDGHMLGRGEGGNERYIKNLSDALKKIPGIHLKIFVDHSYYDTIPQKEKHFYCFFRYSNDATRYIFDLSYAAYLYKADIIHTTYFAPVIKNARIVITVHDISFKPYPEFYSLKERLLFSYYFPFSLQRADAVIVPSQFSKKECIRYFPQCRSKIFVTPEAADLVFRHIDKQKAKNYIKKKYHIDRPFLLAFTSKNPKKNIPRVIKAFNTVKKTYPDIILVIIGEKSLPASSDIRYFSSISDAEVNYFYSGCEIFLYYSLYEGFGLPILEALECGAQAIASDIEVHREVGKDRILYANPFQPDDLAGKIRKTLFLERQEAISNSRGLKERWEATARKTIEAYMFALKKIRN